VEPKYTLSPDLFERVRGLLGQAAGLHFDPSRLNTLQSHLRDRARARHLDSLEDYYRMITDPVAGREELRKLVESVTIHETSFFRNHEHYHALRDMVLPDIARRNAAERRIRIWSAGCSTGEEPYSLAIACLEQPELAGWQITIEASDLSERVLAFARRGIYRAASLRYIEGDRIARWFKHYPAGAPAGSVRAPRGSGPLDPLTGQREVFEISEKVRALINFRQLNLATPLYPDIYKDFDLVMCENVIIYFRPDVTREVIGQFYNALRPGGFLFLGYSETLWQIYNRFELITYPNTFFYRRPEAEAAPPPEPPRRTLLNSPTAPDPSQKRSAPTPPGAERKRATGTPESVPPIPPRGGTGTDIRRPHPSPPPPAPPARSPQGPNGVAPRKSLVPAVQRAPDAALAIEIAEQLTRRAHEYLEAGRYTEAQAAFTDALARNPASVDALVGLAQIHANQGRHAEARAECEKALEIDVLCEEAHLLVALLYREEGEVAEAIDHFEKVLYINFESIAGHFHLAELYRSQGRKEEAARQYRRALWVLDHHPSEETISGLPAKMIRQVCEQQLRRLQS
jgi:chemotaxis protein methyltransferase CheR